jgi:hypothetical protein
MQGTTYAETGQVMQSKELVSVVSDNNISYFGKSNLIKMVVTGASNAAYMSYEPNGDLAVLTYFSANSSVVDSAWMTYPFGSKGTFTLPHFSDNSSGSSFTADADFTFVGTEDITINGTTYSTQKVQSRMSVTLGAIGGDPLLVNSRIDTAWYAPNVKYFVKQSGIQHLIYPGQDTTTVFNVALLKSYTLQ